MCVHQTILWLVVSTPHFWMKPSSYKRKPGVVDGIQYSKDWSMEIIQIQIPQTLPKHLSNAGAISPLPSLSSSYFRHFELWDKGVGWQLHLRTTRAPQGPREELDQVLCSTDTSRLLQAQAWGASTSASLAWWPERVLTYPMDAWMKNRSKADIGTSCISFFAAGSFAPSQYWGSASTAASCPKSVMTAHRNVTGEEWEYEIKNIALCGCHVHRSGFFFFLQ